MERSLLYMYAGNRQRADYSSVKATECSVKTGRNNFSHKHLFLCSEKLLLRSLFGEGMLFTPKNNEL